MIAGRLLSILMLLQARGRMTAPALADALEVSKRTVLRDIDQLSAAGVPVWAARGRDGGFELREGWSTRLTGMTEAEAGALLLSGMPGPATALGLGPAAASARVKLVASLPTAWRGQADRVGQRLHVDPVDWYRAEDTPRFLREVAAAVWDARSIDIGYGSWRGKSRRRLEPLGLVLKAGAWYLVARVAGRDELFTWRLASLIALESTGRPFRRPRGFDLARAWQESTARFEAGLRAIEARLRISPRASRRFINERVPHTPVADAPIDRSGWREVTMPVESVAEGARQLLGYGGEIEVMAPVALRARMRRQAQLLTVVYGLDGRTSSAGRPRR